VISKAFYIFNDTVTDNDKLFTTNVECWSDYLPLIPFSWWIQRDTCSGWAWQKSTTRLFC